MYNITIKDAFLMAKFIVAILDNVFVTVGEIAKFLNIVLGTKTITEDSINSMLVQTKYQAPTDKEEFLRLQEDDESIIYTKYSMLDKAEGLCRIEVPKNDDEDCYFKWRTDIISRMFEFEKCSSYKEQAQNIITKAIQYNLMNKEKESINIETVTSNLEGFWAIVDMRLLNRKRNSR